VPEAQNTAPHASVGCVTPDPARSQPPTGADVARVRALIKAATAADGVRPASDQAMLLLDDPRATHLCELATDGALAGYAQLAPDGSAELVVHPEHRGRGHGHALLDRLLVARPDVRVWAHGRLPGAVALARSAGLAQVRSLWQMARPLADPIPAAPPPRGVTIRTFTPGEDDLSWVEVNAAAFADHPEQGRMTVADLRQRMAEPWFDPAGFFLAERAGEIVGFHWTKVVGQTGEVYVVGVGPSAQGKGLGRTLTLTGLQHLREQGLEEVVLYTEEANQAAVRLYTSLGFTRSAIDVQYAARAGYHPFT
jgi:mycothiol synthase